VEEVLEDGQDDCCDVWTFNHCNVSYGSATLGSEKDSQKEKYG